MLCIPHFLKTPNDPRLHPHPLRHHPDFLETLHTGHCVMQKLFGAESRVPKRPFTAALTCSVLNRPSRQVVKGLIKRPLVAVDVSYRVKIGQRQVLWLTERLMEKRLGPLLPARWKVLAFNSKKQTICILLQFSTERWLKELIVWYENPRNSLWNSTDDSIFWLVTP